MEAKASTSREAIDGHEKYSDELIEAARLLASLKEQNLDPTTSAILQDLKTKFLAKATASRQEKEEKEEKEGEGEGANHDDDDDDGHNNNNNNNIGIRIKKNSTIPVRIIMEIENYVAPKIPPIPTLHGKIEKCSIPYEKQLTVSDVKDDQARLTINKGYARAHLEPLLGPEEKAEEGIPVTVYDKDGEKFMKMTIKYWAKIYVLSGTGWRDLYRKHRLKKHRHFVTMWIFRHADTKNLCVAITYREFPSLSLPYKKKFQ